MAQAPIVPPRPTCAVVVPTVILESPAVDGAIASALVAQVLKESVPPVVGPERGCIDVYFSIAVSVWETAVYNCAAGGVGGFGKHVVSVLKEGLGEEGRCSG